MTDYVIEWDGKAVTLPPAGPDGGVSFAWIFDENRKRIYAQKWINFGQSLFPDHSQTGELPVTLVLIPRPDNPHDGNAVSIAFPKSVGGDPEERCLGYLYRHTLRKWAISNDRRLDLVARLAAFSEDGEVIFTANVGFDEPRPPLLEIDLNDALDRDWITPWVVLDLPQERIMGAAIRDFLAEHEKSSHHESHATRR